MEVTTDLLLVADWGQTRQISKDSSYHEHNVALKEHPSTAEVDRYFVGCLLGNTILHRVLPPKYLEYYQDGLIVVQVGNIINNYSIGLEVKF